MGDIIEITTHAHQPSAFYRMSSGALSFELKAHNSAIVGLAKAPGETCYYWISFGQGGRILIKGPDGVKSSHSGSYSLTLNQYRRFWLAWDCGTLRAGQGREASYIISYPNSVTGLNYVIFTTQDMRHPVTWRFESSPASVIKIASTIPYKKVPGGELQWVAAEDQLPDDAVVGGFQGECVYIIRGPHAGSLTPGKFVPSEGVAYVSWGGTANEVSEFEILCGYNFVWVPTSDDKIPVNAYVAGHSEMNYENLYIGRVHHMNCIIPGKVQPSHKVCYVAYGDRELPFKNYEILTIPESNPYAAGDYFVASVDIRGVRQDHGNDNNVIILNNVDEEGEDDDTEEDVDDFAVDFP